MERPHDSGFFDALSPETSATTAAPATMTVPARGEAREPNVACPFHTVMGQLAQTAVMQQVLHLEGEVLPRADLMDTLDRWQELYRLVRTRVCPATRAAPLTSVELATLVDTTVLSLLPPSAPVGVQACLRRQLVACAQSASPQQCPLGRPSCAGCRKDVH